ncbi:MAG: RDD family protein, partial [Desulfuromonadaceae bacterium]
FLACLVVWVSYFVFFTGYCVQTPGKMLLRIKVIRTSGAEIGYGRAFLREVPGKFLSAILFGIGYLMVAFDERKQGLHDRIADTFVIKL